VDLSRWIPRVLGAVFILIPVVSVGWSYLDECEPSPLVKCEASGRRLWMKLESGRSKVLSFDASICPPRGTSVEKRRFERDWRFAGTPAPEKDMTIGYVIGTILGLVIIASTFVRRKA
jgi:hypothetical protein